VCMRACRDDAGSDAAWARGQEQAGSKRATLTYRMTAGLSIPRPGAAAMVVVMVMAAPPPPPPAAASARATPQRQRAGRPRDAGGAAGWSVGGLCAGGACRWTDQWKGNGALIRHMRSSRRLFLLFQFALAREPNGGMIRPQEPDGMTPARKLPRERRRRSPWSLPRARTCHQSKEFLLASCTHPARGCWARRHFLLGL